jgi:glycosyltransferase involved in cell wall biosynthesis
MNSPTTTAPGFSGSRESYLKLEHHDLVCISVMDWDWPFPTSRHHLMREFAHGNRVLFIDPPLHYLSDYRKLLHEPRLRSKISLGGRLVEREENLYSFTPPPVIPFNRLPRRYLEPVLQLNSLIFRKAVQAAVQRLGMEHPILWISFNPYFGGAVQGSLNEQLTVYHCTDEVSRFPGYSRIIVERERELLRQSDLVVTTSEVLRENKVVYNPNTFFVPNGADVGLFNRALDSSKDLPADLAAIPEPRAGFIGQLEFRFDVELLLEVARLRPNISFVLIGQEGQSNKRLRELHHLPNIYLLGNKPQAVLPEYLRGIQVGIIPYKSNELTRSIYPLKLHEYFAAGRGIVATPLPSLKAFEGLLTLAETPQQFAAGLDQMLATSGNRSLIHQRLRVAEKHSWKRVAGAISELLYEELAKKAE